MSETSKEAVGFLTAMKARPGRSAAEQTCLRHLRMKSFPSNPEALIRIKTIPGGQLRKEDGRGLKIGVIASEDKGERCSRKR